MADMLVEAANWSAEWKRKSRRRVLSAPATAHYIAGWPRDTDLGVIAEADGEPVGAAWLRLLPAADPGYGFVAPDVPELTIGVARDWRGQGVGRALLRALASQARAAGIRQISLSVERKNAAQKLYLSEGYRIVDSSDAQSDTMITDLTPGYPDS
jgi:GNAT superfamily N-acetyltransferase